MEESGVDIRGFAGFGICALSLLVVGAGCEETAVEIGAGDVAGVETGAGDGAGADFGGGCAIATIEAAATANKTIDLFMVQPRPVHRPCQGGLKQPIVTGC